MKTYGSKCNFLDKLIDIPSLSSRHPGNNVNIFLDALDDKLQLLNNNRRKVILMVDLNIDLNSDSSRRADYVNLIESNAFSTLITQPTRVTADSQTIIDHILTIHQ